MKIRSITPFFGFLFFLTAGVTWVSGVAGAGAEGRLTIADVCALPLLGIWLLSSLGEGRLHFKMPVEYFAYLPLLVVYALGVFAAEYPARGGLELCIHVFIFAVSLALYNLYQRGPPGETIQIALASVLWAGGILALLGLVDFFVWPSLLPGSGSGLVGTFRNSGQAGAFFGMYLAVLIPGFLSGLIRPSRTNLLLIISIGVALIFTSKRAALVGFAVGLAVLAVSMMLSGSKRDKKLGILMFGLILLVAPLAYYAFMWGLDNIEGMAWRFGKKFNANTVEDFQEGFLYENIVATKAAFSRSPIIGVGLGNVAGVLTAKYEIHSTYLALLGNSGILGAIAYIVFMAVHAWQAFKFRGPDRYSMYLRYYVPMLVGLMFAWAYTYHLRKREFWILFFVVSLVIHAARRQAHDLTRAPETR
jgi:hypothetical protein